MFLEVVDVCEWRMVNIQAKKQHHPRPLHSCRDICRDGGLRSSAHLCRSAVHNMHMQQSTDLDLEIEGRPDNVSPDHFSHRTAVMMKMP